MFRYWTGEEGVSKAAVAGTVAALALLALVVFRPWRALPECDTCAIVWSAETDIRPNPPPSEWYDKIYTMNADGSGQTLISSLTPGNETDPAWSPDGTRIAYVSDVDGDSDIYVMDANGGNVQQVTDSPGYDVDPSWSPDGSMIAFTSNRDTPGGFASDIYKVPAAGGNVTRLTDAFGVDDSPVWSPDGLKIAFTTERLGEVEAKGFRQVYVMDADGGNQVWLTKTVTNEDMGDWSPDGSQIVFVSWRDPIPGLAEHQAEIYVMDADGGNQKRLTDNLARDGHPRWSSDGSRIVFQTDRDGSQGRREIYVMDADGSNSTRLTNSHADDAEPDWRQPLAPQRATLPTTEPPPVSLCPACEIVWSKQDVWNSELWLMAADGSSKTPVGAPSGWASSAVWSPDGSRFAYVGVDGDSEIYVMGVDGSNPTNLTSDNRADSAPSWSPDGTRIAFASDRDGFAWYAGTTRDIYTIDINGANTSRLTTYSGDDSGPVWSPDGLKIAFSSWRVTESGTLDYEVYVMDADGANQTPLTDNFFDDWMGDWSPDGSKIAFSSWRDGNQEIYVMDADGGNQTRLTFDAGRDSDPAWSSDGSRIVFTSARDGYQLSHGEIYVMNADGSGQAPLTVDYIEPDIEADWRPAVSPPAPPFVPPPTTIVPPTPTTTVAVTTTAPVTTTALSSTTTTVLSTTTVAPCVPEAPVLWQPPDESSVDDPMPLFQWVFRQQPCVLSALRLDLTLEEGFAGEVESAELGPEATEWMPALSLEDCSTYFWRVAAVDGGSVSLSEVLTFDTDFPKRSGSTACP